MEAGSTPRCHRSQPGEGGVERGGAEVWRRAMRRALVPLEHHQQADREAAAALDEVRVAEREVAVLVRRLVGRLSRGVSSGELGRTSRRLVCLVRLRLPRQRTHGAEEALARPAARRVRKDEDDPLASAASAAHRVADCEAKRRLLSVGGVRVVRSFVGRGGRRCHCAAARGRSGAGKASRIGQRKGGVARLAPPLLLALLRPLALGRLSTLYCLRRRCSRLRALLSPRRLRHRPVRLLLRPLRCSLLTGPMRPKPPPTARVAASASSSRKLRPRLCRRDESGQRLGVLGAPPRSAACEVYTVEDVDRVAFGAASAAAAAGAALLAAHKPVELRVSRAAWAA